MRLNRMVFASLALAAGCAGGDKEQSQSHAVKADVGGAVVYAGDPTIRL